MRPVQVGDFIVDVPGRDVWRDDELVHISPGSFSLLAILIRYRGSVVSREWLLWELYNTIDYIEHRIIDVRIRELRVALEKDPSSPKLILTYTGHGYKLALEQPISVPRPKRRRSSVLQGVDSAAARSSSR